MWFKYYCSSSNLELMVSKSVEFSRLLASSNETSILCSQTLQFLQIYPLFTWFQPNAHIWVTTLNFNWFYVSTTSNFLPEFALHFSNPEYENLPYFTFCTSVLRIFCLRQQTFFPVGSHKWFSRKRLTVLCQSEYRWEFWL